LTGRATPDIDDVRAVAPPTLRHRIVLNFNAEADGISAIDVVQRLLTETSA
jgi:MoxR-like ATPase